MSILATSSRRVPRPAFARHTLRTSARAAAVALLLVTGSSAAPSAAADHATAHGHSPRITYYFGLRRPEASARSAFYAVARPGSPRYRRFVTLRRVSRLYGASAATRVAFLHHIDALGLSARVDPSGVFARVSGTVNQFDRIFHVRIQSVFGNFPNVLTYSPKPGETLRLPADLRPLVEDLVTTYARSATSSGKPAAARDLAAIAGRLPSPRRTGVWTRGCAAAKRTGGFSFAQVRRAYGIDRLGPGNGASVAILNVGEGVSRQDIADNARCFGYGTLRTRTLRSDGQSSPFGQGTFEPEEDLALVRGIAPGRRSLEFSQVWLSPELWFLGASQVLDASPLPDSFSVSYGECERMIRGRGSTASTRAGANLMDALFVRLGLAGVGTYSAAGDFGSTCDGQPFRGVAWPASSPFVTAVGGTQLTLDRANRRTREVAWNDLRFESADAGAGASGGGFSIASRRPLFQDDLGLPGEARAVPDVSAVASNFPGWPVVLGGHWVTDGGTSASTPLIATAMAILSAHQRRLDRPPLGPGNGLFYRLARTSRAAFWDVTRGENTYRHGVRGYRAKRGYDLVTGLGVPQFAALARAIPAPGR
jgi:subtilase family serine protease